MSRDWTQRNDPVSPASGDVEVDNGDEARSVAEQVLRVFAKALAAEPGYGGVAARMKIEIIDNQERSEAALRRALFSDDGG